MPRIVRQQAARLPVRIFIASPGVETQIVAAAAPTITIETAVVKSSEGAAFWADTAPPQGTETVFVWGEHQLKIARAQRLGLSQRFAFDVQNQVPGYRTELWIVDLPYHLVFRRDLEELRLSGVVGNDRIAVR